MGFFEAISSVFTKYATFSGRAPRSEFWWFWLLNLIVGVALDGSGARAGNGMHMGAPSVLGIVWHLAVFIPMLAVSVRRLHDIDRTGWWLLLWLIPVIGWIVIFVFHVLPGTAGQNRFGPNPLADRGDGPAGGSRSGDAGYGRSSIPSVPRR